MSSRFRSRGLLLLLFFAAFALLVAFAEREPGAHLDLFENGNWLGPASDMLAGKVPYRETFPVHGFLCDGGMDFLAFSAFGASFSISVGFHQLLGYFFQPVLFLVTAAAIRKPALAAAAVVVNLGVSPAVVFDRPVFALASLAVFLWAIVRERSAGRLFLAGLLGAVGLLYALEFGTFVLLAEVATLAVGVVASRRDGAGAIRGRFFFLGAVLVFAPFSIWLASRGAFIPFLKTSFWDLPRWIGPIWGLHYPTARESIDAWLQGRELAVGGVRFGPGVALRLFLAPALALIGLTVALRLLRDGTRRSLALRILALSLACGFFFRYSIARLHIEGGNALTGPVVVLLLFALHDSSRERARRLASRRVLLTGAAVLLASIATGGLHQTAVILRRAVEYRSRMAYRAGIVPLTVPRGGGELVPADEERSLSDLVSFCERHSARKDPILDLSNRPGLYFFLQRRNPTRFYQVPPMAPFQQEVLRDLKSSPPAFVLLEGGTWLDAMDGIPNSTRIPKIWEYVLRNYPVRQRVGETLVALPFP